MQRRGRRAMRCRYCGSLETVKNGRRLLIQVGSDGKVKRRVQRYQCLGCGKYFSIRRERKRKYSWAFKVHVARMHLEERMSYRVMSKRLREESGKKISARWLCRMVNEVAEQAKDSKALHMQYRPQWEGYLQIDDKNINVRGSKQKSLVAADSTGDAVHYALLREGTQQEYTNFVRYVVEELHYPLRGVTTDFDPLLVRGVREALSGSITHQGCLWHAREQLKTMLEYQQTQRKYLQLQGKISRWEGELPDHKPYYNTTQLDEAQKELKTVKKLYQQKRALLVAVMKMLFTPEQDASRQRWQELKRDYGKSYPKVIAWIESVWELLFAHQADARLAKTNARAENFNKQLKRRFSTIEAFQSVQTAGNYLKLFCAYLRCKPYTDCRGPRKIYNGKAPLEICSVHLPHRDWLLCVVQEP